MRITKLHLQNIGVFEDETIEFREKVNPHKAEIHILTGENGTGKSTILYALASFPMTNHEKREYSRHDHEGIFQRFRANQVVSWFVHFDSGKAFFYQKDNEFDASCTSPEINAYLKKIDSPNLKLKFAFFSYSGYRITTNVMPNSFQPNILPASLLVSNHNLSYEFTNWIVSLKTKEAISFRQNDKTKFEVYRKTIQIMENIISEIIGINIEFDLETEPLNVVIKINDQKIKLDALPDGLKSMVSWIGDLLMRMDLIPWVDNTPILERNFILFLDEIEVHLHPAWQRKILPVVQKMFPNAQIFISTHSPFVVGSVDDAWVYKLESHNGNAKVQSVTLSSASKSYELILNEIFDIKEDFGEEVEQEFRRFYALLEKMQAKDTSKKKDFETITTNLLNRKSLEIQSIIGRELRQLERQTGYTFPPLA